MRILVTGGAGFIGSNLVRRLLRDNDVDVAVIDNLSTGRADNLEGLDLELVVGDVNDDDALGRATGGVDAIVHLAALGSVPRSVADPLGSHHANATGSLKILEAARRNGGAQVLLASSSSVYGANPVLPKREDLVCMPKSPYAVTKLATEQYAMAFAACYDLPVLPFRFFNVYGPRQPAGHAYAAVVPVFLEAALRGRPLPVNGDGGHSRDFTFVGDVCEILTRAVKERVTGGPTNLAFGSNTSLLDLIRLIEQITGRELEVEWRPERPGDVRASMADNSQLRRLFGAMEPVELADGVGQTFEWMRTTVPGSGPTHDREGQASV